LKTGKIGPGRLSKVAGAELTAFQKRIFSWKNIWWISKLPIWLWPAFKSSRRSSEKSVIQ
jgi:hypothetical protein